MRSCASINCAAFCGVPRYTKDKWMVPSASSPARISDCSGFTSYVYKQFGISIQRTASGQLNNGYAVSRGELKPGDLVMFKSYGSKPASHVGIYIGGGLVMDNVGYIRTISLDSWISYYESGGVRARWGFA